MDVCFWYTNFPGLVLNKNETTVNLSTLIVLQTIEMVPSATALVLELYMRRNRLIFVCGLAG